MSGDFDHWPVNPSSRMPGEPHPSELDGVSHEHPDDVLLSWPEDIPTHLRFWTRFDDLALLEWNAAAKQHRVRELRHERNRRDL